MLQSYLDSMAWILIQLAVKTTKLNSKAFLSERVHKPLSMYYQSNLSTSENGSMGGSQWNGEYEWHGTRVECCWRWSVDDTLSWRRPLHNWRWGSGYGGSRCIDGDFHALPAMRWSPANKEVCPGLGNEYRVCSRVIFADVGRQVACVEVRLGRHLHHAVGIVVILENCGARPNL